MDTLDKQTDGFYSIPKIKVTRSDKALYLVAGVKREKKFLLDTVKDLMNANHILNNAYFHDAYFRMSNELHQAYPLYHHSFGNVCVLWQGIINKESDHLHFRTFTDCRIKTIKDSISAIQDVYTRVSAYIVQNLSALDYSTLKDSLVRLPVEYEKSSWYYGAVVNEIAKQKPETFFRIAEDFPENRDILFFAVGDEKQTLQGLKNVAGHDEMKKKFLKQRRTDKAMPYIIVGVNVVVETLLIWVIINVVLN